ncbi:MAG: helix-turn-helix transcriptional regulator [Clostridia bacterium]|nr:helix-turn-helix transcriptional regulator [Clostridia bacterium]
MDAKVRIKQLMQEKNMTEYRLAKQSGLSQSTISNIFIRNTSPTLPTIEAICNGLGITMSQFFSEDDCEEAVYLTKRQKELFDDWLSLSVEQKEVVEKLIKSYKAK